jgi:hypothetical protein
MWLNYNSLTTTIWNQKEIQLAITTTRKMYPFFKSVSPVFGVPQLSVKPEWLRHALFVRARELILCLYLQMRLTLTMSVNQLVWVSHSHLPIPEDRIPSKKMMDIKQLIQLFSKTKVLNYFALPLLWHCDRLVASYRRWLYFYKQIQCN